MKFLLLHNDLGENSNKLACSSFGFNWRTSFCQVNGGNFFVLPDGEITSCLEVLDKDDPRSEIFIFGHIDVAEILLDRPDASSLRGTRRGEIRLSGTEVDDLDALPAQTVRLHLDRYRG